MLGFYNYTVILTYISLCFGVTGIWASLAGGGHPGVSVICLLICGLCDAFDGRVARKRKQSTEQEKRFGIQIDSLCDLICFGILPCCIGYSIGMKSPLYIPLFCVFVLAALIRLAYFNVAEEDRQKNTAEKRKNYQGLPVTSVSLIMPLFFLLRYTPAKYYLQFVFLAVMLLVAAAFIIEHITIRKPSLKGVLAMIFAGLVELVIMLLLKFGVIG